ncbi:MAG: hypothetical protein GEU79_07845 [Acidimicrobiia bacterium]|nr:hypothetical protein [Acidimicrobiia bacterium]
MDGLRFPEVGVMGPFSTDTGGSNVASIVGYGPAVSEATLVGWTDKEFSNLGKAVPLQNVGLLEAGQTSVWIEVGNDGDQYAYDFEGIDEQEAAERLSEISGLEGAQGSETDNEG